MIHLEIRRSTKRFGFFGFLKMNKLKKYKYLRGPPNFNIIYIYIYIYIYILYIKIRRSTKRFVFF